MHTISQRNLLHKAIAIAKYVKSWDITLQASNQQLDALKCEIMYVAHSRP